MEASKRSIETGVCVVGGGPAGLMLAVLLARQGVEVIVLEKHGDFLRDFRGDTVHPSTLDVMDELDLGGRIHSLPHRRVAGLRVAFVDGTHQAADFTRLTVAHPYLMFLPQWDFLEMLASEASTYPSFTLLRSHEVVDLIREGGQVRGVVARGTAGPVEIRAPLTVAADGRDSTVRARLALRSREFGAPMDVLWFRVARRPDDGEGLDMRVGAGALLLGIDRGEYWQIAYVIPKGGHERVVAAGLDAFRRSVAQLFPQLGDRIDEIEDWDDVKVLTVQLDHLRRWHAPGVLLIGDAAHAMSPVGGVGVNLAVQDAVATARLLAGPLRAGQVDEDALARVQARRAFPTAGTQLMQRLMQRAFVGRILAAERPVTAPMPLKLLSRAPLLQKIPARLIGVGLRPEHVER